MNAMFDKYQINTCLRKIHFLAQSYVETDRFRTTYEYNPKNSYSGGVFYGGRGMKQITHDYNYLEYYDYKNGTTLFSTYMAKRLKPTKEYLEGVVAFNNRTNNQFISVEEMKSVNQLVEQVSTNIEYAFDSAGWYWNKNKINIYADKDDIKMVSAKVNHPAATEANSKGVINGIKERRLYYNLLKEIFKYDECK
jgi:predicted chitinase